MAALCILSAAAFGRLGLSKGCNMSKRVPKSRKSGRTITVQPGEVNFRGGAGIKTQSRRGQNLTQLEHTVRRIIVESACDFPSGRVPYAELLRELVDREDAAELGLQAGEPLEDQIEAAVARLVEQRVLVQMPLPEIPKKYGRRRADGRTAEVEFLDRKGEGEHFVRAWYEGRDGRLYDEDLCVQGSPKGYSSCEPEVLDQGTPANDSTRALPPLNESQAKILGVVCAVHPQGLSKTRIAEKVLNDPKTVTKWLDSLVTIGLCRPSDDRRRALYQATGLGLETYEAYR